MSKEIAIRWLNYELTNTLNSISIVRLSWQPVGPVPRFTSHPAPPTVGFAVVIGVLILICTKEWTPKTIRVNRDITGQILKDKEVFFITGQSGKVATHLQRHITCFMPSNTFWNNNQLVAMAVAA